MSTMGFYERLLKVLPCKNAFQCEYTLKLNYHLCRLFNGGSLLAEKIRVFKRDGNVRDRPACLEFC